MMSSHFSEPIPDKDTSAWPKRASKACASCRRDKIRCDGARPCSGCAKKGYAADECTDGCEPCRHARVRCEDGKPCRRCLEMRLECHDSATVSAHRPTTPPLANRAPRGGDRARLACSSCRRDNKKCDDQRPCSRCIARGEECVHVGRGAKLVKLRCEGCRNSKKRCEDSRPCKYCVETSKECIVVPRKGRGHGTRVKAACTNCRRDKIRCNGDRPCASCIKKGCECVERACQTCSRDGKAAECPHRKFQDAGFSDMEGDSAYQAKRSAYESEPPFQISPLEPDMREANHTQYLQQWSSPIPVFQSVQSRPLIPTYPGYVVQPRYFLPLQSSGQPMQLRLPSPQRTFSGNNVEETCQYYDPSNSSGHLHAVSSNSRTLPRRDNF